MKLYIWELLDEDKRSPAGSSSDTYSCKRSDRTPCVFQLLAQKSLQVFLAFFFSFCLVVFDGLRTCMSKKRALNRSCPCCCLLLRLAVPDFVAHHTIICEKVHCVCGSVIFIKSACTQMIISGNEAALLPLTVFNKHFTKFFNPPPPVFNFSPIFSCFITSYFSHHSSTLNPPSK